jgi:hypothetical protein
LLSLLTGVRENVDRLLALGILFVLVILFLKGGVAGAIARLLSARRS